MPVSEPVTAPITIARNKLIAVLTAEFAAEGWVPVADILHKSLGRDGKTRIGVSPMRESAIANNALLQRHTILVQFYRPWKDIIDPDQIVDPTDIETLAERFKRSLVRNDPDTNSAWYFELQDIEYPHDPTGNATRFEARVIAWGSNTSLVETTG